MNMNENTAQMVVDFARANKIGRKKLEAFVETVLEAQPAAPRKRRKMKEQHANLIAFMKNDTEGHSTSELAKMFDIPVNRALVILRSMEHRGEVEVIGHGESIRGPKPLVFAAIK